MRKQAPMVIGRNQSLDRAVDLIQAGISVDIVGSRGSGRTTFLTALRRRLEEAGWNVVSIRGIASLQQHPLAALHLAGIGMTGGMTGGVLHETAEALRQSTNLPRSVLFLDDWDDLDETSWGITESIRRTTGVAVVLSRLQGLRARHTPSGLAASTLEPSYVIDMTPLRFDDMERALVSYLGGPIDANTVSRIFGKTGGNIGLAVNLVDATTREGLLKLHQERKQWTADRDLWSTGLRAVMEGYLEDLDSPARDALEIIAVVGVAGVDSVRRLVDWGTLELLEERSLIAFVPGHPQELITVVPPLLVEFFRHEPLSSRRERLTALIIERLGSAESAAALLPELNVRGRIAPEREAMFVRLLHERARTRRLVAGSEWETAGTPANAVRYISSLVNTYNPMVTVTINRVFLDTDLTLADNEDRANFICLHARWKAYAEHQPHAAEDLLREARGWSLGEYERLLDAAEVEIAVTVTGTPEGFEELLEVTDDLPPSVQAVLWETQLLIMVSAARFADAERIDRQLRNIDAPPRSNMARVLGALVQLGQGRPFEALENLLQGFSEAHGYLDIEGIRLFGAAAALCHVHTGDYSTIDDLLETVFAAGDPTPIPAGSQLGLLAVAALLAARRGNIATSERLAAEVNELNLVDGPLPGQANSWAHVQLLSFNGKSQEASETLWDSSVRLWDRGARYAALVGLLAAAEIEPTPERLGFIRSCVADVPGAVVSQAQLAFLEAVHEGSAKEALVAVEALEGVGRIGIALSACQYAETTALAQGDEQTRAEAVERSRLIREAHPGGVFDSARFNTNTVMLSEREKEVAQLAATGLSNQEIAARLVLSVRTVESHMHRMMRKLNVRNRRELRTRMDDFTR